MRTQWSLCVDTQWYHNVSMESWLGLASSGALMFAFGSSATIILTSLLVSSFLPHLETFLCYYNESVVTITALRSVLSPEHHLMYNIIIIAATFNCISRLSYRTSEHQSNKSAVVRIKNEGCLLFLITLLMKFIHAFSYCTQNDSNQNLPTIKSNVTIFSLKCCYELVLSTYSCVMYMIYFVQWIKCNHIFYLLTPVVFGNKQISEQTVLKMSRSEELWQEEGAYRCNYIGSIWRIGLENNMGGGRERFYHFLRITSLA